MDKLKELDVELSDINAKFPTVNMGGCGFSALAIGQELKKRNIKFKYVLVSDKSVFDNTREAFNAFKKLPKDVINETRQVNDNGFTVCHIMVYYKGLVIDATGISSWENSRWNSDWRIISCVIEEDTLKKWLSSENGWNVTFNRDDVPSLKRKVANVFKKVYRDKF